MRARLDARLRHGDKSGSDLRGDVDLRSSRLIICRCGVTGTYDFALPAVDI